MAKKEKLVIDGNKLLAALNNQEQLRITHAQVNGETCTYSYSVRLENGETDIITNECGRQFHNDLKQAFRLFDGHLAVITEQIEPNEISDIDTCEGKKEAATEKLIRHQVDEIKISGGIESGNISLKGKKILKTNEEISLKTPKQALDDNDYDFSNELVAATQNIINELTAYHNGKSRPEAQMDLFKEAVIEETEITK